MRKALHRSLGVALLILLVTAVPASAVVSGPVTVRVEGLNSTPLPATQVNVDGTPFTKDGNATHTCDGTSAGAALQVATQGNWSGTYFSSFGDYLVNSIEGVSQTGSWFWNFWYDNAPASMGICAQHPLAANDSILFFPDCFGSGCPAGYVSPSVLGLTAQPVAERGQPFGAVVASYAAADGKQSPATGATVSAGSVSAVTDASGVAVLRFPAAGMFTIQATAPNAIRSQTINVCVHAGNDGNCGTTAPATAGPATPTSPAAPTTPTTGPQTPRASTHPLARLLHIADGHVYRHGSGPRLLSGTAQSENGLTAVALRLRRRHGSRCAFYSARSERFIGTRCGGGSFFSIGRAATFSYLLPAKLGPGHYALDVEAIDALGLRDVVGVRGRNEVIFDVR